MATSQIWTEKYRPRTFGEIKGQEEIVKRVKAFVGQKNLPHMIFSGRPGIGKSTLALIIARELFGQDWKNNFLELNASDDRGINVVRETIKDFAKTKALSTDIPKIIFLDEADALTKEAQQALRRTMETYASTARFILSCNFFTKIIDPIKSRCSIFRFKPLAKEDIHSIIMHITKNENLEIEDKAVNFLCEIAEGDVRQIENILQSCASITNNINEKTIKEISTNPDQRAIISILMTAIQGNFIHAREKLLDTMLNNCLSGLDIIKHIQKEIWGLEIPDEKKLLLTERCGEIEFRLVEGSDEFVQLESFLAYICSIAGNSL